MTNCLTAQKTTEMAEQSQWNLMYLMGNSALGATASVENPMVRNAAVTQAQKFADNGWRVWVEHKDSGERIFDSAIQIKAAA